MWSADTQGTSGLDVFAVYMPEDSLIKTTFKTERDHIRWKVTKL